MKRWWIGKIAAGIGMFITAALLLSLVVMLLWNALVPELFRGPVIAYWQAVGLLILSHILLRGWSPWRHRHGWRHDRWKKKFEERIEAMTPEERERFREEWKRRCGWDPGAEFTAGKSSAAPQA
jgi:Ca2+/H+ antiporter, TMEM165/GDT1 family